jgi:hypothetical protein
MSIRNAMPFPAAGRVRGGRCTPMGSTALCFLPLTLHLLGPRRTGPERVSPARPSSTGAEAMERSR